MESIIFSQMELNRNRTLEVIAGITEEQADIVPKGFNNNIRWNIGHILTAQERMAFRLIGEPMELPEELMNLFLNGTKPADWQSAPPDLATLRELLEGQQARLRERLKGRLNEKLTVPFRDFGTLAEALIFSIGHESLHAGYIMALKRATAN
jgi:hypothetical protein